MKPLQALLVALGVGLGITLLVKSFECANNKRDSCRFLARVSVNGAPRGNWTLDDFNERAGQGTFFTEGKIYNGSASLSQYSINGNSDNTEEEIKLCNPHLQTPISITGACGQNVAIIVQLHSNNRTKMADTYNGD